MDAGLGRPITFRGPDLLRALFSAACRRIFPDYQTLRQTRKWRHILELYRGGLRCPQLSLAQRQGREDIHRPKAELYRILFQQNSTAAGDSFLRALGPLAISSGDAQSFTLRLAPHPGEKALLVYLRQSSRGHAVPTHATTEFLRHRGYTKDEAAEVLELLVAREWAAVDRDHSVSLLKDEAGSRESLAERISVLTRELSVLGSEDFSQPPKQTLSELHRTVAGLEERLEHRIEELGREAQACAAELTELIGSVMATQVADEWPVRP